MSLSAEIAVSGTVYSFDMLFSYSVPEKFRERIKRGCRVLVGFGRGNSRRIGVVMGLSENDGRQLKPVLSVVDDAPVLSDELLELALWLREQTFCTYFDAVRAMLPPAMSVSAAEKFSLVRSFAAGDTLSPEASELLESLECAENSSELNELISSTNMVGESITHPNSAAYW